MTNNDHLKRLGHETDLKTFDKNGQFWASISDAAGFKIYSEVPLIYFKISKFFAFNEKYKALIYSLRVLRENTKGMLSVM
jgi:hypothetical protein